MAKKFSELRAGMTTATRTWSDAKVQTILAKMPLSKLRVLSQKERPNLLHAQQLPNVYK